MSRQANPTVVGVFVVGALALVIVFVMVFGSGTLLDRRTKVVAYFHNSVAGLQVGAPVEFRGVPVGTVTSITALYDAQKSSFVIPVYMSLTGGAVREVRESAADKTPGAELERMIRNGLRARLDIRSLVTGQTYVALDFHPDTKATMIGADPATLEIPTISSRLDKVAHMFDELDLEQIAAKGLRTLDGITRLVNSPDIRIALENIRVASERADELLSELDARTGEISREALATLAQARQTLAHTEKSLTATLDGMSRTTSSVDGKVDAVAQDVARTLAEVRSLARSIDEQVGPLSAAAKRTLDETASVMRGAEEMVGENSVTRYRLDTALEELAGAARAVRIMAEYLEQNPDALIKGKSR
ncbi:MAG: MlaD family protein [Gammaproteobacteria bacterium]|nr:MlaD family protein [Gammaproteobacteria bacterium]